MSTKIETPVPQVDPDNKRTNDSDYAQHYPPIIIRPVLPVEEQPEPKDILKTN